jgi:hypothetical protein
MPCGRCAGRRIGIIVGRAADPQPAALLIAADLVFPCTPRWSGS